MAPNITTLVSEEIKRTDTKSDNKTPSNNKIDASCSSQTQNGYKTIIGTYGEELKWLNIISIGILHAITLWGLIIFPYIQEFSLVLWGLFTGGLCGLGVTGGAHRLWCHRSYKATLPLRIFLMLCYSMAGQNTLFDWVRDHRVHHKFTETDADPHNSKRGFFFAHVGWLMMRKHPEVLKRGKEVDMSDILNDPVVQFHQKHFILLKIIFAFVLPSVIPPLFWDDSWYYSLLVGCVGRYSFSLNFTWLVNSAAHIWGKKPYDKKISPSENLTVSIVAMGEGWHNYHHTFPWDYKTAELGKYSVNVTAFWLDVFCMLGLAYDMKSPSEELIKKVIEKHGDGTHPVWGHVEIPETAIAELLNSTTPNYNKSD